MKPVLAIFMALVARMSVEAFSIPEYTRTPLGDAIDKASLKLLKEAYTSAKGGNVISSPLGVMTLLSLYNAGAGNQSRQEINTWLGGSDYKQTSESYSALSNEFAAMNPDFLTLANKIYVEKSLTLNDAFLTTARDYKSEVESINFADAKKAADTINQWADEKTKGHIKTPVSEDIITPDTVLGLFNVIFFQGHWHVPFNASETKDEDFHVNKDTTVKKPTMHLSQSLFYTESEELGAKMIELPCKEEGFRMVIVLPNEMDGLPSVMEKASVTGLLSDIFRLSPSGRDVKLHLPKFEIKSKLDLNDILPKIGVSKIFEEPATGIVKDASVAVSKAFQEAFVKVNEEGATAGAFTGILAVAESWPPPPPPTPLEFRADHPFLFAILYNEKMIFTGTFSE